VAFVNVKTKMSFLVFKNLILVESLFVKIRSLLAITDLMGTQ